MKYAHGYTISNPPPHDASKDDLSLYHANVARFLKYQKLVFALQQEFGIPIKRMLRLMQAGQITPCGWELEHVLIEDFLSLFPKDRDEPSLASQFIAASHFENADTGYPKKIRVRKASK